MTTIAKMTLAQMKKANPTWFDKGAMKFFNTTIETQPNKNNAFITSEYMEDAKEKKYTIRQFNMATNQVDTIGEFNVYETIEDAKHDMKYRYSL